MFTNLKQHDKFLDYCRQLLPDVRITQLRNLSLLVIGLLNSTECHLSSLAEVIPLDIADLSIEKRMHRWLKNKAIDVRTWYEPFVRAALVQYAPQTVYVVMDTTKFGPSCQALVAGLAYGGGQVIPLGWRVLKGKKGHTKAAVQEKLLDEIRAYLPAGQVVLVADSEFCAVPLLDAITNWGWHFIVRVRGNVMLHTARGEAFSLNQTSLQQGQTRCWSPILWTDDHLFGPLMAIATWNRREKVPLYVITSTADKEAALLIYAWRFWIEPLFADLKGRGFNLAKTRIRDPKRLSRLLLAACIAFLWSLAVGSHVFHSPQQRLVDRNDRSDRSLFQLGYRYLKRLWKLANAMTVSLAINPIWFPIDLTLQTVG